MPAQTRSDAIDIARTTLDRAGVSTEWRVCDLAHRSADCDAPYSGSEVSVRLVPRPSNRSISGLAISFVTVADGTGAYTSVFYDLIAASAHRHECATSLMLGYIMAHELGHLLGLKHASRGIMKRDFGAPEMDLARRGLLVFSDPELRSLRAAAGRLDASAALAATN